VLVATKESVPAEGRGLSRATVFTSGANWQLSLSRLTCVSGHRRTLTDENGPHGRRPPTLASVCRRCRCCVQAGCDLTETLAGGVLSPDAAHDIKRKGCRASKCGWRPPSFPSPGPPLSSDTLELVDRDQPRAPWHLDRLEERQHAAGERRAADAEGLGRLRARVGESLDALCLADDSRRPGRRRKRRRRPLAFRLEAPDTAARHGDSVHKRWDGFAPGCICVSSFIGLGRFCTREAEERECLAFESEARTAASASAAFQLDQAADGPKRFEVLFTVEGGEHPGVVADRGDYRASERGRASRTLPICMSDQDEAVSLDGSERCADR